jgi:hypothetical protein
MLYVGLTQAERQKADDLIQELLDLVDDGHIAADGPAGVALARRLEGAMLALRAMDRTTLRPVVHGTNIVGASARNRHEPQLR